MSLTDIGKTLVKSVCIETKSPDVGKYMCNYCCKVLGFDAPSEPWICGNKIDDEPPITIEEYAEVHGIIPCGNNTLCESFEEYLENEAKERELMTKTLPDGTVICQSTKFSLIEPERIQIFNSDEHNFWKEFTVNKDDNIYTMPATKQITELPPLKHAETCNNDCNNKILGWNSDVLEGCFNTIFGSNVKVKGSHNSVLGSNVTVDGSYNNIVTSNISVKGDNNKV